MIKNDPEGKNIEPIISVCNPGDEKNLGFFDLTPFVKFNLSGKYAHEQLQYLCTNNIKNTEGRTTYTQMLNPSGGIEADLTVSCLKSFLKRKEKSRSL